MSKWRGRKKRESERRKERDFCFRYSIGCVTVERCSSLWLALCLEGSPWRKGTLPTPWRAWTINWGQRVRPPVATCSMCEGCSFLFFIFKQASRLNSEVGGITVEWACNKVMWAWVVVSEFASDLCMMCWFRLSNVWWRWAEADPKPQPAYEALDLW